VDTYTSGWQPGDLIIIAARPSMGKTAFTLTAARNAALHPDENLQANVAIFSLEMSAQQLVQRFLTMEARIDAQAARTGRLKDDDFKRLIDAASRLFTANIFIDDTPSLQCNGDAYKVQATEERTRYRPGGGRLPPADDGQHRKILEIVSRKLQPSLVDSKPWPRSSMFR
jgi:replicative DNA helicase